MIVVMSDVGTKHACWQCGTRFYDFNKPDPACPRCGANPTVEPCPSPPFKLDQRHGMPCVVLSPAEAPLATDWFEQYGMTGSAESWQVLCNAITKRQDLKLAKRISYNCDGEALSASGELEDLIHMAYAVTTACEDADKVGEIAKKIPKRQRK